jgi:outer membrane protein assembly factor BamB
MPSTTLRGYLYALDATTGAILFSTPMSAGSNAPVAVDGDYVIAGAGVDLSSGERNMIIAYKLGATGKLPDTVGSLPDLGRRRGEPVRRLARDLR